METLVNVQSAGNYEREDTDCHAIVDALNWVLRQFDKRVEVETEYIEQM